MNGMERYVSTDSESDAPRRIRARDVAVRYGGISERLAGDWLRAMLAAGVATKIKSVIVARWSAVDAWVEAGGKSPIAKTRKSPPKVVP